MAGKQLSECLHFAPSVHRVIGNAECLISSIEFDSRLCGENTLFAAIDGGERYAEEACERGATVLLLPDTADGAFVEKMSSKCTILLAKHVRRAFAEIAHAWYDFPAQNMKILGVTGTNGKTTTTFILKQILESIGEKVGLIGTTGHFIGVEKLTTHYTTPEPNELCAVLSKMRETGIRWVVMEVSSHGLSLERVHGLQFFGAIFTNLTQDHLDFHGTMENYARAKKLLFDGLERNSIAVVNGDSEWSDTIISDCKAGQIVRVGRNMCDVTIADENYVMARTSFVLEMQTGKNIGFHMPLIGSFNVENAALAIVLLRGCGFSIDRIQTGLAHAEGAPGRMQRILLPLGALAVVDYAHSPDALEKALKTCRHLLERLKLRNAPSGKLICVFGCGGNRDIVKRPLMGKVAVQQSDEVILTSDNPRTEDPLHIIEDIRKGISESARVTIIPDRAEAITHAIRSVHEGDLVLIAGKGHEDYQIIGSERRPFSDAEHIRSVIEIK